MQLKKAISLLSLFWLIFSVKSFSAETEVPAVIKITGYVDAYYAYYNDSVGLNNFQKFPSVCPRSNHFGLNTAHLGFQYDAAKTRAAVVLHYGDIPVSAWSGTFNPIMEAHAGVRLSQKCWIDAGFFRTHVGAEGLLPVENITTSISVPTFFEPYFESGIRLNYLPNNKWSINILALNGFNTFEDNNEKKSFGALVTYAFSDKGNIGYSNYVGDDAPVESDSISHLRIFQNLFFNYQFNKLKMQVGIDNCMQENSGLDDPTASASMLSGLISFKYQFTNKFAAYTRGEFFSDPDGFMGGVITDRKYKLTGIKLFGITGGVECAPVPNAIIRLEARELITAKDQEIFYWKGEIKNNRLEVLLNIGVSF